MGIFSLQELGFVAKWKSKEKILDKYKNDALQYGGGVVLNDFYTYVDLRNAFKKALTIIKSKCNVSGTALKQFSDKYYGNNFEDFFGPIRRDFLKNIHNGLNGEVYGRSHYKELFNSCNISHNHAITIQDVKKAISYLDHTAPEYKKWKEADQSGDRLSPVEKIRDEADGEIENMNKKYPDAHDDNFNEVEGVSLWSYKKDLIYFQSISNICDLYLHIVEDQIGTLIYQSKDILIRTAKSTKR